MYQVFIEGGVIRKLWGVERDAYRDHLLRLDAESRRNRFCGTIADSIIRAYAATARGSDVIVHGFFVDGVLRGAADLRLNRREAEAAFSIEKRWQSLGIGSALLERSLLAARNRGIKRLEVWKTRIRPRCRSCRRWRLDACSSIHSLASRVLSSAPALSRQTVTAIPPSSLRTSV